MKMIVIVGFGWVNVQVIKNLPNTRPTIRIRKTQYLAHRISYRIHYKVDPYPQLVLHTCHNIKCVNPFHLYLGNNSDNMFDRSANGYITPKSNTKINQQIVDEIREYKKQNPTFTQEFIANQFDLSQSNISRILANKIWQ